MIRENGSNLSGGEKQRIGVAKALALQGSVYIFDEVMANPDPKTEKEIFGTIYAPGNAFASLTISHNLNVMGYMDRVFTVSGGSICELDGIGKDISEEQLKSIYSNLA